MVVFKLVIFIPEDHKEKVKEAMFKAGAGKIGHYDCCSFETEGLGQFRALEGSDPFIGQQNFVETVKEFRVEMVCEKKYLKSALKAMKQSHPYETPAYDVLEMYDPSALTES